ncbi:MAG TPA: DUF222 domain-containing protein [Pseudonocardia sp.]|nr:DUF222 domain-containing protein [Pseudonocardia sp.]
MLLRGPGLSSGELIETLTSTRELGRLVEQVRVETVAALERGGVFAEHGYRRPDSAVADLLTLDRGDARRVAVAAEQVCPRTDLQGQELPPRLPAMAAAFSAGAASVEHVVVAATLLHGAAAARLSPEVWAGAEEQIAGVADECTPSELDRWGARLIEALDQDGAQPDDRSPAQVNELRVLRRRGGGGRIVGRFDDAARFAVIAAVLDAKSAPLTGEDSRTLEQRQADALVEVVGFVADHGDARVLPGVGGQRPQVTVIVELADLENRARAACLDLGGTLTPTALRLLCCDATVIPVVMNGAGQPLDVGRATRTIPDGLRRAVAVRDRGCAHPGCDRPPTWCEIHHIKEWSRGGETRLDNLVMLCRVHHREIHSTDWAVRIAPDGLPEFRPPTWIDPQQRPRRSRHARPLNKSDRPCPVHRTRPTRTLVSHE